MPKKIQIPTFSDNRGSLGVIEKFIKFKIKRVYFLYNLKKKISRGMHAHKKNIQFLICLQGQLEIKFEKKKYFLGSAQYGILIKPSDWHEIVPRSKQSIVLVVASDYYDKNDYII
jgi:dTDP-4-dehydrorhamnose 3,5-epimerase-like enzyme